MAMKTENLAILMTDIVGFTEATVHQSRFDIETLLATHNRVLLPIVRRYRGRHIKSIGDALLLAFRSPTDAMLCAMAMQDALYEYNRSTPKDRRIHIRVGASLGEVRVTRNDIFGEPVNLTSRVAGITPADEIYLSEALYMAMNKAEVPSQEVGWKDLKGIGQSVRIYNIPRFSQPRLVADALTTQDLTDLVYPYGGAHLTDDEERSGVVTRLKHIRRGLGATLKRLGAGVAVVSVRTYRGAGAALARKSVRIALALLLAVPVAVVGARFLGKWIAQRAAHSPPPSVAERSVQPSTATTPTQESTPRSPAREPQPASIGVDSARQPPVATPKKAESAVKAPAPIAVPASPYPSITAAKRAYKEKKITKDEFKRIEDTLEKTMESEKDQAKRDYKEGNLTTLQYKLLVEQIERKYE